jgi:hypothetical protein
LVYKLYKGTGIKLLCVKHPLLLLIIYISMLPLGPKQMKNQKMPDTGYKLDGMELHNSVSTRWPQYGQQMMM